VIGVPAHARLELVRDVVFVTDDGAETDLDIGHYERFLDEDLDASSNVTTGITSGASSPSGT
jgi:hypothetical protein